MDDYNIFIENPDDKDAIKNMIAQITTKPSILIAITKPDSEGVAVSILTHVTLNELLRFRMALYVEVAQALDEQIANILKKDFRSEKDDRLKDNYEN